MIAAPFSLVNLLRTGHAPSIIDGFGRAFAYLRVSVTDLCNLRCVYCMPEEGVPWVPREEILRFEEILEIVEAAAQCGVRKVRLTGGEPLIRKDICKLVRMIASVPGINELALTTNGTNLAGCAEALAAAGLKRVNISLDTLDPIKFKRITRRGDLSEVLAGIGAAERAGLQPLKLNMVVLGGINEEEVESFASLTHSLRVQVRFIELMPLGEAKDCAFGSIKGGFVSNDQTRTRIEKRWGPLIPVAAGQSQSDPAQVYRLAGALGSVGFISAMSSAFCARCNRLRLTADGKLRSCLLDGGEVDVRAILRGGNQGDARSSLAWAFQRAAYMKPEFHTAAKDISRDSMSRIGG